MRRKHRPYRGWGFGVPKGIGHTKAKRLVRTSPGRKSAEPAELVRLGRIRSARARRLWKTRKRHAGV